MGYTTEFEGRFNLDRPLTEEQAAYLRMFSRTRRMARDASRTALRSDPTREAVDLPVGTEGEYFVGEDGWAGQDNGPDVVNGNNAPSTQPGLWCQWVPTEDLAGIEWDGGEKFYRYEEWLRYIVENFLQPWGYTLNGEVTWEGEESDDTGTLYAIGNYVGSNLSALQLLAREAE
jgi:hypothetical protein